MDEQTRPRPDRAELFGFYYLGFSPEGTYRFPNVRHVAAYYRVSHDLVIKWLDELDLSPRRVLFARFELARVQVDLQMDAANMTPEALRARVAAHLKELDAAPGGRKPWED